MYVVGEEIYVPDISDYFTVALAAEMVISTRSAVGVRVNVSNVHIVFIDKPSNWRAFRIGEYLKNFSVIANDYSIYECSNGIIIPVNKVVATMVLNESIADRVATIISAHNIVDAVVLISGNVVYVIEPAPLRYLCFKVIPKGSRVDTVKQVDVEYFWEIVSLVLTSDRKTAFDVRMLL